MDRSQFFVFDTRSLPASLISENCCNDRIKDFVLEFLSRYMIYSDSHAWLPSSSLYIPNSSDTAVRCKQEMCAENLHSLSLTVSQNNTQCYSGHTNLSTMKFINSSLALILEDINIQKMARECVEALRLDQAKKEDDGDGDRGDQEDKGSAQMGHNEKISILIFTTDRALLRQARNIFVDSGEIGDVTKEVSLGGVHNDFKYDHLPQEPHDTRLFEMMANGSSSIDLSYPMGRRLWETSTWEDQLLLFKHLVNLISVAVNPNTTSSTRCEVKILSANTSMSSSDNVLGSSDNAQQAEIQKLQAFLCSLSSSSLVMVTPSPASSLPVAVSLVQVPPLLHFYEQQLRELMNACCPQVSAEVELVSGTATRCSLSFSLRSVSTTGADLLHALTKNITLETVAIVRSEGVYGSCLQGPTFDLMPSCNETESTSTESMEQNLITFNAMCCSLVSRQALLIVKLQESSLRQDSNTSSNQSRNSFWAVYAVCGEGVASASMVRLADKDNFLTDKAFSYDSSMYMNRKASSSSSSSVVSVDKNTTMEAIEAVMTSEKQAAGAMDLMQRCMSRGEGTPLSFEAKSTINFMESYFDSSITFISDYNPLLFSSDRVAASIAFKRRVQSSNSATSSASMSRNVDRLLLESMLDSNSNDSLSINRAAESNVARARECSASVVRGVSFQMPIEDSSQDSLDLCAGRQEADSSHTVPPLPSLLSTSGTSTSTGRRSKEATHSISSEMLTSLQTQSVSATRKKTSTSNSSGSSSKSGTSKGTSTTKTTAAVKKYTRGSKRHSRSREPSGPWPSFLCDTSDEDEEDSMESYRQRNAQSRGSRETFHRSSSSEPPSRKMKTRLRRKSDGKLVREEAKASLYTLDDMDCSDEIEASL